MRKLAGKVAIVTGASGGLGQAIATQLSAEGTHLVLADVVEDAMKELAASLPSTVTCRLDVSDEAGWGKACELAIAEFGQLDILVNNAGIDFIAPLQDTTLEQYNRVIAVNQTGCFLGMRAAAGIMRDGGAIVNISSIAGMQGLPDKIAYVASKFAVRGMTKVAALELANRNIRVNSIHPGGINTNMLGDLEELEKSGVTGIVPLKRVADPEEIANFVLFLVSDLSPYATGAEFVVDGGILAGPTF